MSSDAVPARRRDIRRLLDLVFGFFVWAAHFLVVYIGTALACVLGLGTASAGARNSFALFLGYVTILAAVVVLWHAFSRYARPKEGPDEDFGRTVTMGGDAIALVAILWQIFSFALIPACA